MAYVTNYMDKECSVTNAPGNYGNGKDDHAPVGYTGTWRYRELMRFSSGGPPSGAKIVSCILRLKTTDGNHSQQGGSPRIRIRRLTETFVGSSSVTEQWRTDANPAGFVTSSTSSGEVAYHFDGNDNTVYDFDITDIYEDICSEGYFKRDGSGAGGATNYGIEIRAGGITTDENDTADRCEFWSMRGSYQPRVIITWTVPDDATAPTLQSPLGVVAVQPTAFSFLFPSGDGAEDYEIEVGTGTAAPAVNDLWNPGLAAVTPGTVKTVTYAGSALPTNGSTVYWRVRGRNEVGTYGPWTSGSFTLSVAPTVTHTTGAMAEVYNIADGTAWTSAEGKARLKATYTHPQGLSAAAWEVRLNGGTAIAFAGGTPSGGTATLDMPTGWTRNTNYSVEIRAQGSGGNWSAWTAAANVRINWAQGIYPFTYVAGSNSFVTKHDTLTTDAVKTKVHYLYRNTTPSGPWQTSPTSAVTATSTGMDMLIRLSSYDPAINPTLPKARLEWQAPGTGGVLDHWSASAGSVLEHDRSIRRFGMHSVRMVSPVGNAWLTNNRYVECSGGIDYTISAYIHAPVDLTGTVVLGWTTETGYLLTQDATGQITAGVGKNTLNDPDGWRRLYATLRMPGSIGDTVKVKPGLWAAATASFWVDAFQLEEGSVATGWKPGMAGPAVVLDIGGIAVDRSAGGTMRLIGNDATLGARALVELSDRGLRFAGDAEVYSPVVDTLQVGDGTSSNPVEFISAYPKATGGQFRAISSAGGYGFIVRVDGTRAYFLLTNVGDPYGTWNALRPFYIDLATGAVSINSVPIGNPGKQLLTSSGNFTKPVCMSLMVEVVGGGGGGGGCPATTASQGGAGAGGGGGGYSRKVFTGSELAALPSSIPYTIGAGGTAGPNTSAVAGNGGLSSFNNGGAIVPTGGGGLGGEGGTATTTGNAASPGLGGAGSNGDLNIAGSDGGAGRVLSAAPAYTGFGGGSYFAGIAAALSVGSVGKPYGGGAAGVQSAPSASARVGQAGAIGVILVTWW